MAFQPLRKQSSSQLGSIYRRIWPLRSLARVFALQKFILSQQPQFNAQKIQVSCHLTVSVPSRHGHEVYPQTLVLSVSFATLEIHTNCFPHRHECCLLLLQPYLQTSSSQSHQLYQHVCCSRINWVLDRTFCLWTYLKISIYPTTVQHNFVSRRWLCSGRYHRMDPLQIFYVRQSRYSQNWVK